MCNKWVRYCGICYVSISNPEKMRHIALIIIKVLLPGEG